MDVNTELADKPEVDIFSGINIEYGSYEQLMHAISRLALEKVWYIARTEVKPERYMLFVQKAIYDWFSLGEDARNVETMTFDDYRKRYHDHSISSPKDN